MSSSKKLERKLLQNGRRSFREWIANSLKLGAGALHKYTKTFGEPARKLAEVWDKEGKLVEGVLTVNKAKAQQWGQLWEASDTPNPKPH